MVWILIVVGVLAVVGAAVFVVSRYVSQSRHAVHIAKCPSGVAVDPATHTAYTINVASHGGAGTLW